MSSVGDEAADFMAQIGKPLLPWQRDVVRDAYGIRRDGKWAAYEVCLLESRQQGKGVVYETQELFGLYMLREQRIIHSAHLFDTSREAFGRLVDLIEGSDWLTKRTNRIDRAHGKEGIELTKSAGGGKLKFKARTLHGTRGFTGERINLDEAYALTAGQFQAISPILATLPNPQITYASSPPDEKTGPMPADAMLPSIRKRGIAGDPRMVFYEWSPPEGFDPEDVDVWYLCNPSLGYLIDEEFLASQLRIFKAAGKIASFSTEHLGAWHDDEDNQWRVITEADWSDAQDPSSAAVGRIAFTLDVTPERSQSALAVAGLRADGDLHAEVVDHRPGTSWAVGRLVELCRRWKPTAVVVDPAGAAGALIPDIEEGLKPLGIELTKLSGRQVAAAWGLFRDGVSTEPDTEDPQYEPSIEAQPEPTDEKTEPTVVRRIRIRPHPALTLAVAGAAKRRVGDGTSWDRRSPTVDISPLVATTNAVYGFVTTPEPAPVSTVPLVAWR